MATAISHRERRFGQTLASIVMIIGYGIIAVPTGIVSVEPGGGEHLPS